jgi:hypothetical protein
MLREDERATEGNVEKHKVITRRTIVGTKIQ